MKNAILIGSSILLIILSIGIFINKRIAPMIENNKILKQQQEDIDYYNNAINKEKEEEQEKNTVITDTIPVKVPSPQNDDDRVGIAIGSYFSFINNKQYDKAYNLLYDKYKELNFPNLEDFQKYCMETYKDYKFLNYNEYERNNDVIIANVTVKSITEKSETFNQEFSILEISDGVYRISIGL